MIENLLMGFSLILQPIVLTGLVGGTVVGYLIGAMPGLGPTLAISLVLPFTFAMDPILALVSLTSLYVAAEYGSGITAILINAPGTPSAVPTAWDGYPMAKKGEAGFALNVSILSSGAGAFLSTLFLIATAAPLSELALRFGPAEYFALGVFGLSLVSSLGGSSLVLGFISLSIGVVVTTIGMDPVNGVPRFSPNPDFYEGIPLVPALLGLFALSEVLFMLENSWVAKSVSVKITKARNGSFTKYRALWKVTLRGSVLGYLIGVIPGPGASIASVVSYSQAKRSSKDPDSFGKGNPEGVCASESANNAAASGSMAPLLALGIPGSATTAILIGAFLIQGIQPGPMLFTVNPEIPYAIFASLLIGIPLMVLFGLLGARMWVKVIAIPAPLLAAMIVGISLVGSYATVNSMFPVYVTLAFGLMAYILRKANIPLAPIVLAVVLVPMIEVNFRRTLLISDGSYWFLIEKPIAAFLLLLAMASFIFPMIAQIRRGRKQKEMK